MVTLPYSSIAARKDNLHIGVIERKCGWNKKTFENKGHEKQRDMFEKKKMYW